MKTPVEPVDAADLARLKRWFKIVRAAFLTTFAAVFAVMCLFGLTMVACSYAGSRTQKIMDTIHVGDTKESVIAKLGVPSDIEPPFTEYGRYDAQKCQGECVERLWYEHRICLDEAWLVALDRNNKVITTGHVVSP